MTDARDPNARDPQFYNRADAHINLSNQQVPLFNPQPTTDSMVYASARFAAWLIASTCANRAELTAKAPAAMARMTEMFHAMLDEHMADHISRFDDAEKAVR